MQIRADPDPQHCPILDLRCVPFPRGGGGGAIATRASPLYPSQQGYAINLERKNLK